MVSGDSRAVLSRGDVAIPLTDDHKAAREDETVRVSYIQAVVHCAIHVIMHVQAHLDNSCSMRTCGNAVSMLCKQELAISASTP